MILEVLHAKSPCSSILKYITDFAVGFRASIFNSEHKYVKKLNYFVDWIKNRYTDAMSKCCLMDYFSGK